MKGKDLDLTKEQFKEVYELVTVFSNNPDLKEKLEHYALYRNWSFLVYYFTDELIKK
ncbi:hypothetical protein LCGC14_0938060 [marine sediment metagenome]|uniref:Uncharacterized protein n=1 Tax=marine sediment metagenome TaxID=412755 RepID=A0A0F9NKX7_9ZZZZ